MKSQEDKDKTNDPLINQLLDDIALHGRRP